jgi:DNA-binding response OmpR family regulator
MPAKILVVDDHQENATTLAKVYESRGYITRVAFDGAEALEVAMEMQPDMILLDVQLPLLNGFEVLEELRRRRVRTKVIMFSGIYMDFETAIRCIKAGACDFLLKPLSVEIAIERVRKHLVLDHSFITEASKLDPLEAAVVTGAEQLQRRNAELQQRNAELQRRNATLEAELRSRRGREDQAFVVMQFGEKHLDSAYEGVIKPVFEEHGITCLRIDEVQDSGLVTDQVLRKIDECRFVLADLSGERPNCYYETGFAHALKKDMILTIRRGDPVHFDLAGHRFIQWETEADLRKQLRARLASIKNP